MKILDRAISMFIVTVSFDLWFDKRFEDFAILPKGPFVCICCHSVDLAPECAIGPINVWIGVALKWHS